MSLFRTCSVSGVSLVLLLSACSNVTATADSADAVSLSMGDGHVDGRIISPYEFTWAQCMVNEGAWTAMPSLTEAADPIGPDVLRLKQTSQPAPGQNVAATVYLNRKSLAPLRVEQRVTNDTHEVLGKMATDFTPEGFTMTQTRGDQSKTETGTLNSNMFHGMMMGLPLAVLDYSDKPFEFDASMLSFRGTYKVKASLTGQEALEVDGQTVTANLIDVEWLHNESGDIYPPGPDGSGGRYWVVKRPPEGVPHVLRYQTDTYAIEISPGVCPT